MTSITMAAAKAAENHGDKWCLTWHSLTAAEALSLKISSHGTSPRWSQRSS